MHTTRHTTLNNPTQLTLFARYSCPMPKFHSTLILLLLLLSHPLAAAVDHENRLPNIIILYADDLGYGDVKILNPEGCKIETPGMDRVAKEGMVFTDAHSASSVCSPSRYALLTGRYSWRTRLQESILYPNEGPLITADRLTLPKLLFGEGYHTAMVGKWHLGCNYVSEYKKGQLPKSGPIPNGRTILYGPFSKRFQYYYGAYTNGLDIQIENDREVFRVEKLEDIMPLHTRKAVEYIEQRAKTKTARRVPFFLYYAMVAPHTPLVPSAKYKGSTGLGDYADFLAETDGAVTAVLDALDRTDLADQTIVIFTTDNGTPENSERKLERQKSSAHLRGYKGDAWDGGHRVPTFIRWPGVIKPGSTSNALACQTDFLATFAELAGIHLPDNAGEDSVSLLSVLKGAPSGIRDTLVSHSFYGRFAFRQGAWKLQFSPGSGGWSRPRDVNGAKNGLPPIQLYNLKTDPGEKNNLHAKYPGVVWHLTRLFEQQIESGRSTPGTPQPNEAAIDIRKIHLDHPEDIAKAVGAIAEGRLDFSTGQVINVDGGFHLRRP